ncbi:MAG TPA: ROK family protein [Blastocatellia bacterium]|nr:ROK family protein [Blastocatellia bacterium]
MNRAKAIGIIIGGTKISVGVVSSDGTLESQTQLRTNAEDGFTAAIKQIVEAIHGVSISSDLDLKEAAGVGVGCTGPVDPKTGRILTDFTLPGWGGGNIITELRNAVRLPVLVENDVDAAVVGEAFIGGKLHSGSVVLITLGTGVGGGVLINGEIYRGSQGEHPEIGHIIVRNGGPECYCGGQGCLEMAASGTAIEKAGRLIGLTSAPEVFARANAGESEAKNVINQAIESVSVGIWTILHTFLPELIVLGGGIMDEHFHLFEPAIKGTLAKATMIPQDGVRLRKARVGNDSGIIGAAVLAFRQNKTPDLRA